MPEDKIRTGDKVQVNLVRGPAHPKCPKCGGATTRKPGGVLVCMSCGHKFTPERKSG